MIRRSPLSRSRKPLRFRRDGSPSDREKLKAEQARVTGSEYRSVYLAGVFRATGCDLCARYRPPAQQHHTRNGGQGRKADATRSVIICGECHRKIHDKGAAAVLAAHGLPPDHLDLRALEHEAACVGLGYWPVELCEECKTWHSKKFMLWEVQEASTAESVAFLKGESGTLPDGSCRRICTSCAPEGPP